MAVLFANNNSLSAITALPSDVSGGAMTLLETKTASSDSTLSFTSNIDSTYKEYIFKFTDIHPSANDVNFMFNGSDDSSSHSYDVTKTTSLFRAYHYENGSAAGLGYRTSQDIAQGTGFQDLNDDIGNNNDSALAGYLHLFDPSSTTFVKHFIAQSILPYEDELAWNGFIAGYFNTTSAITAIQFKFDSGTIDAGTIKMYGVS